MIGMNLKTLRKINNYTQEEVAEKINVSRQSVAKWENNESIPDINSCAKLAKLYNVTLDNLVNYSQEESGIAIPPKGKVAKWENNESIPDINSCAKLAKLYNVTLDNLVNYSQEESGIAIPPKGKHFFGSVTVGERGQIVIPKEARELFNISTGDKLLVLGDEEKGIAIVHQRDLIKFMGDMGRTLDK